MRNESGAPPGREAPQRSSRQPGHSIKVKATSAVGDALAADREIDALIADCPDCGSRVLDQVMEHEPTCPIQQVADASSAADREWFVAHPAATEYWRPLDAGDIDDLRRLNPDWTEGKIVGRVRVWQLEPGLRARDYGDVRWLSNCPDCGEPS